MSNKKAAKRERKAVLDEEAQALRQSRIRLAGIAFFTFLLLAFALSGVLYSQTHPVTPTASATPTAISTISAT